MPEKKIPSQNLHATTKAETQKNKSHQPPIATKMLKEKRPHFGRCVVQSSSEIQRGPARFYRRSQKNTTKSKNLPNGIAHQLNDSL